VLKHNCVQEVDFVEIDKEVVDFSRRYLSSLGGESFDDPRVRLSFMDGRAFVETAAPAGYDIVIMDMTDPAGPSLLLYTKEFFRLCEGSARAKIPSLSCTANPRRQGPGLRADQADPRRGLPRRTRSLRYVRMYGPSGPSPCPRPGMMPPSWNRRGGSQAQAKGRRPP
jgi:hypothetical protein